MNLLIITDKSMGASKQQPHSSFYFHLMAQLSVNCVSTSVFFFYLISLLLSAICQDQVEVKHTRKSTTTPARFCCYYGFFDQHNHTPLKKQVPIINTFYSRYRRCGYFAGNNSTATNFRGR